MRSLTRGALRGLIIVVAMTMVATSTSHADDPVPGSQGTDTSLPATDSQVTVHGRDGFADLAITVNQTEKLANQAVSITWTGGKPTHDGPGRFGSQYLQIFQCWGDDDGTVPGNPGPPPEQCEQGAVAGMPGGLPGALYPGGFALGRIVSRSDWQNFDPKVGHLDVRSTNVWLPFRAVDGTVVDVQADVRFNPAVSGGNYWLNPYYNIVTTNEIAGAATGQDGRGAELFQVLTGVESSGLGCGQRTQPVAGGDKKVPQCWIVVVPRGTPADENVGTPFDVNPDESGVVTSPVSPAAWEHRIAIPIAFNPVDSPCALGADERRLSGSELALPAIASWQPALCTGTDLPPYSYAPVSDSSARQQLGSTQPGAPGMVVVSRPLSAAAVNPASPVVYAPVSLSGLVIGFNIERNPHFDAPAAAQQLAGVRIADLNLTPRLVAKLLTQSYGAAVSIASHAPDYPWVSTNPTHMALDPDFQRFNPEFALLQIADGRTFSGLQLPAGNSDAAQQVWEWILADPEARAWMNGEPDEWGMKVNPVYATTAAANSTGIPFGDPTPNSFPKADPYCYQAPPRGPSDSIVPPPLCGTDWMPYRRGFSDAAQVARTASDGAKIEENPFALTSSDVWKRAQSQFLGKRDMLALTDTPSAAQFGLQTASLSRAGDNGPTRTFIAPDAAGLTAGVASMATVEEPQVLEPSPTAVAPDAYPLTSVTYAAIEPLSLDAAARADYAAFLAYAAIPGQVPGLELGQLPRGYAPLPVSLQSQTLFDSVLVQVLIAAPQDPEPTTTTTTSVPPTTTATTVLPSTTVAVSSTTAVTTSTFQAEGPDEAPFNPAPPTTTRRPTVSAAPPVMTTASTAPIAVEPPVLTEVPTTTSVETTNTAAPATTVAPTTTPAPTTTSAASMITTAIKLAKGRFAVPGIGLVALGSGLGALEITKRPRRRRGGSVPAEAPSTHEITDP